MIPIEKNIIVTDDKGNEYEATYPKRAKGLVKNGRARFVDNNTICLACPPIKILEDNKMNKEINESKIDNTVQVEVVTPPFSMEYVLKQIEKIYEQNTHIHEALSSLVGMNIIDGVGDIGSQGKAQAISDVVKCRETTNQLLLKMYEKMYEDIKPQKQTDSIKELLDNDTVIKACIEAIHNSDIDSDDIGDTITGMYSLYESSRRFITDKLTAK